MNRIARLAGFALVLLLLFLAALATTQHWLGGHTERLRQEMIVAKQTQFDQALALARLGPPPWSEDTLKTLSTILGGTVTVSPATGDVATTSPAASPAVKRTHSTGWEFTRRYTASGAGPGLTASTSGEAAPAQHVRVRFAPPAVAHLISLYQQSAALLLFLALGLLLVLVVAIVFSLRARTLGQIEGSTESTANAQAEMRSLTHLAQVSVRQSSELERERSERQRAEEDTHFQQMLLNRALEEKIRLGHDLHDGIIQSLYAAGLTVEAAKNLIERDPAEAHRQLEAGVKTINTTIREVRGYIAGLSPESLSYQSFADAIRSLTQTLDAGRAATYDLRIDEAAANALNEEQAMNLLQIVREAVSNGLRHGGATHITVRLHQSAGELCLLVQDDGRGFTPAPSAAASAAAATRETSTPGGGHGLANMRARAERSGGTLQFSSSPGHGAKLIVTLPTLSPPPAA